eukprot:TRINITY_DN13733_c0_g1_i2.p1 TRINITY_DN13733_c0_g1~~TRINITY_DN13733_c0_g1_i2.p1  ORF type:complete len:148 (-),score=72.75 TRINITY_DN13733_c0_g1_i2:130-528(-)
MGNQPTTMDSLAGVKLAKADGSLVEAEKALAGKELIAYYFSGHWCPPCRRFTPMLKTFYQEASALGVEIVFVSSDQSEEAMADYMKESHGDWFAVPYGEKTAEELSKKYDIAGIPSLVVVKLDGTVVTEGGG